MTDLEGTLQWLVDGAPGAAGAPELVAGLCERLVACGIPLERGAAYVRTLHPQIIGRSFLWRPGAPVEVRTAPYEILQTDAYRSSPLVEVFERARSRRWRLADAPALARYGVLRELAAEGFTDYFAGPLRFLDGATHAASFATRREGGFSDEHLAALERVLPPLSRLAEILALRRTAANLLDTYVGRSAGERIIAGEILRGALEIIPAVIWFSDMRGFTALAAKSEPAVVVRALNDLFDCQVPAIDAHGGEVLKFMGDGLFGIFPGDEKSRDPGELCARALDAAAAALASLRGANTARAARGDQPIAFGLALHYGVVGYGNIGAAGRLDFTCVGPAVNLAARLEALSAIVAQPVVTSADFARLSARRMRQIGVFELKGVAAPQAVFVPEGLLR